MPSGRLPNPNSATSSAIPLRVVNDTTALNQNYRADLIAALVAKGYCPQSVGLFEGGRFQLRAWLGLRGPVIASNLRSNLCVMALWHLRGLVILNGLGRHRGNKILRRILVTLVRINRRKTIAVQNRADYRFLRRHTRSAWLVWVPGSGGTARNVGQAHRGIVVSRDDKIALAEASLARFIERDTAVDGFTLIGCTKVPDSFARAGLDAAGRVPQDQIFAHGNVFVQPAGYGEGIPHSLVDAILSGMEIWIDARLFLQTGLSHIGARLEDVENGWGRLHYNATTARSLGAGTITAQLVAHFAHTQIGQPPPP